MLDTIKLTLDKTMFTVLDKSKFEKAVEHIKSIPKISMHVSATANLIYPKIYQTRPQAERAIRKMVAMGVLEKDGEYITKGNTS